MGGSTDIRKKLLGDTSRYERVLSAHGRRLAKKYSDSELSREFLAMGHKFISMGPMSLCDSVLSDLGMEAPDSLLAGIGLMAFHISTHDDIVDETPSEKSKIAALLYSGNIALIEGLKLMDREVYREASRAALQKISTNHYMQQKVAEILWKKKVPSKSEYFRGIRHIISWTSIGPFAALAYSKRLEYSKRLGVFCENYGLSIQFMDDMSEIDEDIRNGYWSLPIIAAKGRNADLRDDMDARNELIEELKSSASNRISKAKAALPRGWNSTIDKADRLIDYISGFKYG
jgi:hypothetical protein